MKLIVLFFNSILLISSLYPQNLTLEGSVKDFDSGRPMPLVNVFLPAIKYQTVTDAFGNFKFDNLRAGQYNIIFSHVGYKTKSITVIVKYDSIAKLTTYMVPSPVQLGEIPVYSSKNMSLLNFEPIPVNLLNADEIKSKNAVSAADILKNEPGLALQRDGIWGTQISIRGLSKSSIVLLVDGNRMETATDLSAALSMIDLNDIQRIEVIKGGVSSLYGTGALGGIVNIITKEGMYNEDIFINGSVSGSFATVNNENMENLSLEAGANIWYARINSSFRKAGDTETPSGYLTNSQFSDNNISFSGGLKPLRDHELKIKYQNFYAKNVGIPGGNLLFPSNALVTYPNEQRQMFSAEYKAVELSDFISSLSAKYFYQIISRNVSNIPFQSKYTVMPQGQPDKITDIQKITPHAMHYTNGIQAEGKFLINRNNFLVMGFDGWQRTLDSRRERFLSVKNVDKTSGQVISTVYQIIGERPIPEAKFQSTGIYVQDEFFILNDRLKLEFGGRFDWIKITSKQLSNPVYTIINGTLNTNPPSSQLQWLASDINNSSWSSNIGLMYSVEKGLNLTFSFARSFRSPSLEERYQYIDLGNMIEIGNPSLKPERGYFLNLGTKIWNNYFVFNFDLFNNIISNLVIQKFDTTGAKPELINSNVGKASLYGLDGSLEYNAFDELVFYSIFSYVRGRNTGENQNLPQIPPFNGSIGLRTPVANLLNIDFSTNYFFAQNKIAEGEISTPGYSIFNLYISSGEIRAGKFKFSLFGGIENILDKSYRSHLATNRGSVTSEPGRNFFFKTVINW